MASRIEELPPETVKALVKDVKLREREFLLSKGTSILQVPCSRAIAGQHKCLMFGNLAMCPENCVGFLFGSPVDDAAQPFLQIGCNHLDRIGEDYYCLETGTMNEEIRCASCSMCSKESISIINDL
ncbi:MAG: hypothetical protein ACFFBD_08055 [Candidatus Hodarchaeota archaeon]